MKRNTWIFSVLAVLFIPLALYGSGFMYNDYRAVLPASDITPFSIFQFFAYYWAFQSEKIPLLVSALAPWTIAAVALWAYLTNKTEKPLGDARWANKQEVHRSGLYAQDGIILGKHNGKVLKTNEPCHVLLTAPTRAGKGVGVVIPNLLSWQGSVVVLDIKQENHEITSGYRATLGETFLFSPMQQRSHRYNPLDLVRSTLSEEITDVQQIANFLVPTPDTGDQMWASEARNLFVGLALYVLHTDDVPSTIGQIYRTLNTQSPLGDVCGHIVKTRDDLPPACIMALSNFRNKADKEQSGVKSSLTSALNLWANPTIDAATSASDFHLDSLRKNRQSIYVGVTFSQIATVKPLLSLLFQQTIDVLSRAMPESDEPHTVLMLIDEFPALGRMAVIENSLPVMAGYGIRMLNICQGLSYLDKHYSHTGREGFLQNSAYQIFFAPNDDVTAKFISERLGQDTIQLTSSSKNKSAALLSRDMGSKGESASYSARAFLLPQEVRQFDKDGCIIFRENQHAIKGQKIQYYQDTGFTEKLMTADSVPDLAIESVKPPIFDMLSDDSKEILADEDVEEWEIA